MDTDDLSKETYNAIILTAEKFHNDLTLQFGLLTDDYENENEYLQGIKDLIVNWQCDLKTIINEIFFDNPHTLADFNGILIKLNKKIDMVLRIPIEKRNFD
jgi:hypothetical protein